MAARRTYRAKTTKTTADQFAATANRASTYVAERPWLGVALGVGVMALGWSTRKMWLPIAAAATIDRFLPNSIGRFLPDAKALKLDQIGEQLRSLKPTFMS